MTKERGDLIKIGNIETEPEFLRSQTKNLRRIGLPYTDMDDCELLEVAAYSIWERRVFPKNRWSDFPGFRKLKVDQSALEKVR